MDTPDFVRARNWPQRLSYTSWKNNIRLIDYNLSCQSFLGTSVQVKCIWFLLTEFYEINYVEYHYHWPEGSAVEVVRMSDVSQYPQVCGRRDLPDSLQGLIPCDP